MLIMLDNFNFFLVFPINRFHPALDTAAPCNLVRVTVEGGNRVLESELCLLDLTVICPHLTSCFLSSSLSSSWASSHLAFEQTEMSSYSAGSSDVQLLLGAGSSSLKECMYVFHFTSYFSGIPSYTLTIFGMFNHHVSVSRIVPFRCWKSLV